MPFFKSKRQKRLEAIEPIPKGQGFRQRVIMRFRKNRMAVWAFRLILFLSFIGLLADFIANEKPIYCKIEGKTYWPVFHQYGVDLGWTSWDKKFFQNSWQEHDYDYRIMPPIPYSPTTIDIKNASFTGPFDQQDIPSLWYKHWLGTDQLGRDVTAGMIHGTRVALQVGIVAMSIATLIGIFFGAIAGFFGDNALKISRIRLFLNVLGMPLAWFYGFMVRQYTIQEGNTILELGKSLLLILLLYGLLNLLASLLEKIQLLNHRVTLPIDMYVMRVIETLESVPGLLLLLAMLTLFKDRSVINVMIIIGLISWMGIARFIRAELLRVRTLEYIEAARAMGFNEHRILLRHAIPNALTPVMVSIAFGIAGAILLEAFLSFLGIGVAIEDVTWGSLLSLARQHFSAWWLAIFPGMAIFITVTAFNLLGDGLTEALDPKSSQAD